jgi:opacity protein-like surface antigen
MPDRVHTATLATAAAFLAGIAGAEAADYIPEPAMLEQPVVEYAPTPYYSRVDCAAAFNDDANLRVSDPELHFIEKNGGHIETDDSWSCDVGLGLYVHQNVRLDTTLEYRGEFAVEGFADPDVVASLNQRTAVNSFVTLFNAYYDFGDHWGWTPYVGGGIGFAYNTIDDAFVSDSGFVTVGGNSVDFAWALMAGASTPVSPDLLFDIGYRYVNFGDVSSGITGRNIDGTESFTSPVLVRDMDAHEVRAGFRYNYY